MPVIHPSGPGVEAYRVECDGVEVAANPLASRVVEVSREVSALFARFEQLRRARR